MDQARENEWRRRLTVAAQSLLTDVAAAAASSPNEQNLRHAVESSLQRQCALLDIPWTPFQLDRTLRDAQGAVGFVDVVHGAIIIEYEPPNCFSSRGPVQHAQAQAEDYARKMSFEEGRPLGEYVLVAWDGSKITFGSFDEAATPTWERVVRFDLLQAERLLRLLRDQGRPLVHPAILRLLAGPDSEVGAQLLPRLFAAARVAEEAGEGHQTKTALLFKEWRRLFGQAVGIETDRLGAYVQQQSLHHRADYGQSTPAYLFALHTYIALVAKLVAAMALPNAAQDIGDASVSIQQRVNALESGQLFADAGIANMLAGDFFSWYLDDVSWDEFAPSVGRLVSTLAAISFDLTRKEPHSIRDLFKGMYEVFVPRELRHALGEIYTPDWLAAHALDVIEWNPSDDMLDPTCGTGTFVLEALKRRMTSVVPSPDRIGDLLQGIYGIDLNPLAVLAAKASLIVVLANRLEPDAPIALPIYLADAINCATESDDGFFTHTLQTELGPYTFEVPARLVRSDAHYRIFDRLRQLISANRSGPDIATALAPELEHLHLSADAMARFAQTIDLLVSLHRQRWDGIWCPILADRFAAGSIRRVSHIVGNPPWVKWSHLPPAYARFIKPLCLRMNVFSQDRYVGGIESDISTVITFRAIESWLQPDGTLAFFITATVFSNESSQGFRRFRSHAGVPLAAIQRVEDFKAIAPFEGVTNHPSLLVVRGGRETQYPVLYRIWNRATAADGQGRMTPQDLLAKPVPGSDAGPWLKGAREQHDLWATLFDASHEAHYKARKGITTDLNGVYFVRVKAGRGDLVEVSNDPDIGRTSGLSQLTRLIEPDHVFHLIRGRGLSPFRAQVDPDFKVIVPQRQMNGDPTLPESAPRTFQYLDNFRTFLVQRGSYRRYQADKPFWSTWSTGAYTFSPHKVLWKEMSGSRFCAAYTEPLTEEPVSNTVIVPDHKLYFVPVTTLSEAQYLTGLLNAPSISSAISAYAAQLSLGTSVIENLTIPEFDDQNAAHTRIAEIAARITARQGQATEVELAELSALATTVVANHG